MSMCPDCREEAAGVCDRMRHADAPAADDFERGYEAGLEQAMYAIRALPTKEPGMPPYPQVMQVNGDALGFSIGGRVVWQHDYDKIYAYAHAEHERAEGLAGERDTEQNMRRRHSNTIRLLQRDIESAERQLADAVKHKQTAIAGWDAANIQRESAEHRLRELEKPGHVWVPVEFPTGWKTHGRFGDLIGHNYWVDYNTLASLWKRLVDTLKAGGANAAD